MRRSPIDGCLTDNPGGLLESVAMSNSRYLTLDDPLATLGTVAYGVNDIGTVVGSYTTADIPSLNVGVRTHGFVYSNGVYTTLDDPLGSSTIARGVNNLGQVVGTYVDSMNGKTKGFFYENGIYTTIDYAGISGTTIALGVNDSSEVFVQVDNGYFKFKNGIFTQLNVDIFALPVNGISVKLNSLNNNGVYAGGLAGGSTRGLLYDGISIYRIGFNDYGQAYGLNDIGSAVGIEQGQLSAGRFPGPIIQRPYIYSDEHGGNFDDFIDFSQTNKTLANDINNAGQVVGSYTDATGTHGYLTYPNTPPTFAGFQSSFSLIGRQSIKPFSTASITDKDAPAQTLTVTVTLDQPSKGTFSDLGLVAYDAARGTYSVTGSASQVSAALDNLTFNSRINAPIGTQEIMNFQVAADDGFVTMIDTTTSVTVTSNMPHYNPIYRFYDTVTNDHFYTTSSDEAASIRRT